MSDVIHTNKGKLKPGYIVTRLGQHYMVEKVESLERFMEPTCESCGSVHKNNGNKAVLEFVESYVLVELSDEELAKIKQRANATFFPDIVDDEWKKAGLDG